MGAVMMPLSIAANGLSGGIGAFGAMEQGQAEARAAKYNAAIARENAQVSLQNAEIAGQAGMAQQGQSELKNRAVYGQIKSSQAASGLDVNTGSAVNVRASSRELGSLDAYNIRANAVKQAYGYQIQSVNQEAEANLQDYEAKADIEAGDIKAAGTLLGAAGQAGSQYSQWQLMGGGFG